MSLVCEGSSIAQAGDGGGQYLVEARVQGNPPMPTGGDGMDERVPRFDGTPELLPGYKEKVIQYMMGIEWHKRYLVGPRLLRELSGVAQSITRPATIRNPQWLSHPRGGYTLLEFLEENLARPSLIDASHHIMKFVYNTGRQRGESMTEWSSRYSEALWEASTALPRV